MIFLVPENSFKKKIEKWVKYKDFVIVDATDRHDGEMREYGNRISGEAMVPTPTLQMIATGDPTDAQIQIKKRRINTYLDMWFNDESIVIFMHRLVSMMVKSFERCGEDCNIFVVLTKPCFYAYHQAMEEHFNMEYQVPIMDYLVHKMDKAEIKKKLTAPYTKEMNKRLKEDLKRISKAYKIKDEDRLIVDDFDGIY